MILLEIVQKANGMKWEDEDGDTQTLEFMPGLSEERIDALEARLPGPIPPHIRELLAYTAGCDGGPELASVDFTGELPFKMPELFPHGLPIADDGFGDFWVVDLLPGAKDWGPVFYACHDPAVIIYHTATLQKFVEDVIRSPSIEGGADLGRIVNPKFEKSAWKNNRGMLSYNECLNSRDASLREFAGRLDKSFVIADLRNAQEGDGFYWGAAGPNTVIRRFGNERIFAYQKPSFFQKLLGK